MKSWTVRTKIFLRIEWKFLGFIYWKRIGREALVDTGCPVIVLPDPACLRYLDQIGQGGSRGWNREANGDFSIPCNVPLPALRIRLGNYKAEIPGESLKGESLTNNVMSMFLVHLSFITSLWLCFSYFSSILQHSHGQIANNTQIRMFY